MGKFPPPRSKAMQKVAQWLWAMRLFDEISKSKLLPTAATHSSLISSFETWDGMRTSEQKLGSV